MKIDKPDDRLRNTGADAPSSEPRIYALRRGRSGWNISRRGLVGAAAAAGMARTAQAQSCANAFAHTKSIVAAAVSPDGKWLVTGSYDRSLKLWTLPAGALAKTMLGHTLGVLSLVISGDGRLLVSGDQAGWIRLWSMPEGVERASFKACRGWVDALAITPDGELLAVGGTEGVSLWLLPECHLLRSLTDFSGEHAIVTDGRILASGGFRWGIRLWSLPNGAAIRTLDAHHLTIHALAASPDGRILAYGGAGDNSIRLCSLPDGTPLRTLVGHTSQINALAVTPDGGALASASDDATVRLWSLPEGNALTTLEGHTGGVDALTIAPDGQTLYSAGSDKTIRRWSLPDGALLSSCFMDLAASPSSAQGMKYESGGVTYTLPCGSAIPPGAVCTCNCVPGTWGSGGGGGGGGGGSCTCVPVIYWYPN